MFLKRKQQKLQEPNFIQSTKAFFMQPRHDQTSKLDSSQIIEI